MNELADGTFHNFTLLTHGLTNDLTKLKDRANFNDIVLKEMNYPSLKRGRGIECKISTEKEVGYAIPICLADFKKPYCGCEGRNFSIKIVNKIINTILNIKEHLI